MSGLIFVLRIIASVNVRCEYECVIIFSQKNSDVNLSSYHMGMATFKWQYKVTKWRSRGWKRPWRRGRLLDLMVLRVLGWELRPSQQSLELSTMQAEGNLLLLPRVSLSLQPPKIFQNHKLRLFLLMEAPLPWLDGALQYEAVLGQNLRICILPEG